VDTFPPKPKQKTKQKTKNNPKRKPQKIWFANLCHQICQISRLLHIEQSPPSTACNGKRLQTEFPYNPIFHPYVYMILRVCIYLCHICPSLFGSMYMPSDFLVHIPTSQALGKAPNLALLYDSYNPQTVNEIQQIVSVANKDHINTASRALSPSHPTSISFPTHTSGRDPTRIHINTPDDQCKYRGLPRGLPPSRAPCEPLCPPHHPSRLV